MKSFSSLTGRRLSSQRPEDNVFPFVRKGSLNEFSGCLGSGKTEMVLRFLSHELNSYPEGGRAVWIEESLSVFPRALTRFGIDPQEVLFVESGKDLVWSASRLLKSNLFSVLVLKPQSQLDVRALRRLQILSERAQAKVILLREEPSRFGNWVFKLQLRVQGQGGLEILRNSGRKSA